MQALQSYALPPEVYARAADFAHARQALHFAGAAFSMLVFYLMIRLRLAPRLARMASSRRGAVLFIAAIALIGGVAEAPLDIAGHAISLRFGISIENWPAWWRDWASQQALGIAIAVILIGPFYWLARRSPRRWWLWGWLASLPLLAAGALAGPLVLEPLFNRFVPLANSRPDLVDQVQQMLARAGISIPRDHVYEMKASEKTRALNAYVSGFGPSRRVVLYDTIIRQEDGAPLVTTIGHELGHYALHHIAQGLAFAGALLLIGFALLYLAAREFIARHGAALGIRSAGHWGSLPVFLLMATILGFFAEPLDNAFSRRLEHEADLYSLEAAHGIVPDAGQAAARAFQIEGETNLDLPDPGPFLVFWLYSHPPTSERLRFSLDYRPWGKTPGPKYLR